MPLTTESGSPAAPLLSHAARIHLVGPQGSGKSWLARRLAAARGGAIHHLDDLAHEAGGGSPLRPEADLEALIRQRRGHPWRHSASLRHLTLRLCCRSGDGEASDFLPPIEQRGHIPVIAHSLCE